MSTLVGQRRLDDIVLQLKGSSNCVSAARTRASMAASKESVVGLADAASVPKA